MEEIIIKSNGNSIYNTHKFIDYKKKDKCCGCYPSYKDPECESDCHKPKPGKPPQAKASLVCGREVNRVKEEDIKAILEFPIEPIFLLEEPIILARVETDLSCYTDPIVSIDFTTFIDVSVDENVVGIVLTFRLKRTCGGREYVPKDYDFTRFIQIGFGPRYELKDSFKILYCDNPVCTNGCCQYTVELLGFRLIGTGRFVEEIRELVIDDSAIRAIVQDLC